MKIGDFYWDYADIMRGLGIKESVYDERILSFMAIKLLIDNNKLSFNFNYKDTNGELLQFPFNLTDNTYIIFNKDNSIDYRKTFLYIIKNIRYFNNTEYFISKDNIKDNIKYSYEEYNLNKYNVVNELELINSSNTFDFKKYIEELPEEKFLAVLDIYIGKADFNGYPQHKYKNLYEDTVTRMKKLSGTLTGQHFTQSSIIHLMTELGTTHISDKQEEVIIYDPSCGVGSMLYDSAYYYCKNLNDNISIVKDNISTIKDNKCEKNKIYLLGQEINGPTWVLAKIFSEISGFKNFIAYGNTLTEPVLPKFLESKQVDFIIANPPFGMDWKTEKTIIENILKDDLNKIENMANFEKITDPTDGISNSKDSLYYVITKDIVKIDKKTKQKTITKQIITPKISDGQWLFFMHIAKALENNHNAKALIISSTSLLSNGDEKSDEGIIRKHFIENGFIETIIEQPNGMFTNTDIKTHLWVMDKQERNINNVQLIKIDNDFINKKFKDKNGKQLKTIKLLFDKAEHQIEKQKNGYNLDNIKIISTLYNRKEDFDLFCKNINKWNADYIVSFEQEFNFNIDNSNGVNSNSGNSNNVNTDNILNDLENLKKTEKVLHKSYFIDNLNNIIDESISKINKSILKVQKYIDGSIYCEEEYFNKYEELYKQIIEKIIIHDIDKINNKKEIQKVLLLSDIMFDFKKEYRKIEKEINMDIMKYFETIWEGL